MMKPSVCKGLVAPLMSLRAKAPDLTVHCMKLMSLLKCWPYAGKKLCHKKISSSGKSTLIIFAQLFHKIVKF